MVRKQSLKSVIAFFHSLRGGLILTGTVVTVLPLLVLEIAILLFGVIVRRGRTSRMGSYPMDPIMPGMDGVEATRRVKKTCPGCRAIAVTSCHKDEHTFPAIRAGALSYVSKYIDPDELAEAIRLARAGEAVINPRVASRTVKELHGLRDDAVNPFRDLSGRELEVLKQMAAGKSNHEIGEALFVSEKTVNSPITSILNKLHLAERTQAAVYAWQEGIVRRDKK